MIINLTNHTVSASIDTLGAQLISLKDQARLEYIWQRNPRFWKSCSPLLFPAVGNCRNGRTQFEGTWYDLPKHGFCRNMEFHLTAQKEDSATLSISSGSSTKTMYPYDFVLSLTYTLTADGIHMDYLVKNTDARTIYFCLGAHPGFNCPLHEGERFEEYQLELEQEEHTSSMVYDLDALQFDADSHGYFLNHSRVIPLSYDLFDKDAIYFDRLLSRKVSIVHSGTRKGVEVAFPDFETVAFWTPMEGGAPLLCVEPWNGSAVRSDEGDEFTRKHHVQHLDAGEIRKYHLGIRFL